jgi:ketosteroid isomerase-like protein
MQLEFVPPVMKRSSLIVLLLATIVFSESIEAESSAVDKPESTAIMESIAAMDAKMFKAFNAHDVDMLMSMFADDLEFYHDKGGLTNYQQTREGFTKMFGNSPDIIRTIVPHSMKVYPIKDYGAIELGTHRFCHKENGKDDCGNFPFVMIWKKVGDSWKVSRVVSYGH